MRTSKTQKSIVNFQYFRNIGAIILILIISASNLFSIPALDLKSTANFAILAGATITGIPPVTITGNVGLSPAAGSYISGFDGSNVTEGFLYVVDASGPAGSVIDASMLQTAKSDLTIAYNDAAGRTPVPTGSYLNPGGGNIGGLNLTQGLYKFTAAAAITGSDLTLTGSNTDVWIFQIGSSLNLGSGIKIILAGGAQAANIFWQVGTSATLGTYSVFKGTILADQSITLGTGAKIEGRALAFSAAVTLASDVTTNKSILKYPIFSVNFSEINFNNAYNGVAKKDSVIVTNTGNDDLVITSISSSNAKFTVSPSGATIAPGATKKYYFTFLPTSDGSQTGYILFNHNAQVPKDSVKVSGIGTSAIFSANKSSINFGNVSVGNSKKDSVIVSNIGTASLVISSLSSSNSQYTFTPANSTIPVSSNTKFYITFSPNGSGNSNGFVYFNHNGTTILDSIAVSGSASSAIFTTITTNMNFGNVSVGTSKKDSMIVTNTGTSDLVITSISSSNPQFTINPTSVTIASGLSQKFYVNFAPLSDGIKNGFFTFNHNAAVTTNFLNVSGNGVSPIFSANHSNVTFGNVRVGTSVKDSVIVTNLGTADLIISSITSNNSSFVIVPNSGTIAPGAASKFYITFSPLSDNLKSGFVFFNHNAANLKDSISVSGTGISSKFTVNFTNINFGNVRTGTSKKDSIVVTNTGTADLIISSVTSSSSLFVANPTSVTISTGSSQKFYVTFSPLVDGAANAFVYFNHNGTSIKDSISVSGTGVAPKFTSNVSSINFGNVRTGTSKKDSILVTNTGSSDLIISSISSNNSLFTFSPILTTLTPGASQKVYVTYAPIVDGFNNGMIYFNHNANNAKDSVAVSGFGVSPKFSANVSSLNFGNVRNFTSKKDSIIVTNTGTSDLIINNVTSSNGVYVVNPTLGTITPGSSLKYYVTFTPITDGLKIAFINFNHNATGLIYIVTANGTGVSPKFSSNISSINFGDVRTGTSKMDSITVSNIGTSDLTINSVLSTNPIYTISSNLGVIAPGSNRKYYVTYSPIVDGYSSAFAIFNHNADKSSDSVALNGRGVSPKFDPSSSSLDFGNVIIDLYKFAYIDINNHGTSDLVISEITSSDWHFTVSPTNDVIPAGTSHRFYFTFKAVTVGLKTATIVFHHNAGMLKDTILLRGVGIAPNFSVFPKSINFGTVTNGTTKIDSVVVSNTGNAELMISNITSSNSCFVATSYYAIIPPGGTYKFYFRFTPLSTGYKSAYIEFYNAYNLRDTIFLSGSGIGYDVAPLFTINPNSLDFGKVDTGSTKMDSVKVTNDGNANLVVSSVISSNPAFTITPQNAVIMMGKSQTFFITFAPLSPKQEYGIVTFNDNATNLADHVQVIGQGIGREMSPILVFNQYLGFGSVFVGQSKQKNIWLKNIGNSNLVISSISSNDSHFKISPLFATIAPNDSMEFFVTFTPTDLSTINAKMRFTHNVGFADLDLSGSGLSDANIITIKEARDLPIGTEFVIEGIVTRSLGDYTRIQDASAAITILHQNGAVMFNEVLSNEIEMGDLIRFQAKIMEFKHLKIIVSTDIVGYQRISRMNTLPAAKKVTLSQIAANGEMYESQLVKVQNLDIASAGDTKFLASKIYQTIDFGDRTNAVEISTGKAEDTEIEATNIISTSATFEGVLSQYSNFADNTGYQLVPVLASDIRYELTDVETITGENTNILLSNFPNPFSASTEISYTIYSPDFVSLKVFDLQGNEVQTLVNQIQEAGTYHVSFDIGTKSNSLASNMFYYRLVSGANTITKQMLLLK